MARPDTHVGTSGWNYWHWRELFYPQDLPRNHRLAYYQARFDTLELLKRHAVALCIADRGGRFPSGEHRTAEFVYLRFHGGERLYASRYTDEQMRAWAEKLAAWRQPAFVYFNNDVHGYAVENALTLKQEVARLEGRPGKAAASARSAGTRNP